MSYNFTENLHEKIILIWENNAADYWIYTVKLLKKGHPEIGWSPSKLANFGIDQGQNVINHYMKWQVLLYKMQMLYLK